MKTRKALKGRFKLTAKGKLLHFKPGRRHIMTKKSPKRKRQLANPSILSESMARTYRDLM